MRRVTLSDDADHRWSVDVPETRRERMEGMLHRPPLGEREGLLFERTRSVHTFGMRRPIGVALLDAHLVVRWVRTVRPGRVVLPRPGIRHVLECEAGDAPSLGGRLSADWGPH